MASTSEIPDFIIATSDTESNRMEIDDDGYKVQYQKNDIQILTEICLINRIPLPSFSLIHTNNRPDGSVLFTIKCEIEDIVHVTATKKDRLSAKLRSANKMIITLKCSIPSLKVSKNFQINYLNKDELNLEKEKIKELVSFHSLTPFNLYSYKLSKIHQFIIQPDISIVQNFHEMKLSKGQYDNERFLQYVHSLTLAELKPMIDLLCKQSLIEFKIIHLNLSRHNKKNSFSPSIMTIGSLKTKIKLSYLVITNEETIGERKVILLLIKYLLLFNVNSINNINLYVDSDDED